MNEDCVSAPPAGPPGPGPVGGPGAVGGSTTPSLPPGGTALAPTPAPDLPCKFIFNLLKTKKINSFFFSVFSCPRRPNLGREGRPIVLRANHFQISMPRGFVHHYDINIQPDKCPRKVNREIIETMVHAYTKIFGTLKPVFDGRQNLYTRDPLPIGNDRVELEVIFNFFFH